MIHLRPYQSDLVASTREAMTKDRSVLMQLATGAGKTACASYIVHGAQVKKKRVFFTVHRKDLVKQTALAFDDFNIPYSYIAAGKEYNPFSLTHICSIDTLRNKLGKVPDPDLIVVDESHMSNSSSWSGVINYYLKKGAYVIGLSATPWRLDGSGLGKLYGSMVCGPPMRWLIDNGYLCRYRYFAPSTPDLQGVRITGGDYNKQDLANKYEGESVIVGDAMRHYRKYADGKRAIVYCVSREHSKRVAADFCAAGIPACHMDGETLMDERARIISDYADGRILVITNVDLITTGFDLAAQVGRNVTVEAIILMRPTRSLSLYLQMVGRGMRPKDDPCIILDHAGCIMQHDLPDADRTWSLQDRIKRRGGGERAMPVRQCTQCHRCFKPAPVCPGCGYMFPIEYREVAEVDGELEEIAAQEIAKTKRMEVGRAKTVEDLERIADERGYRYGWVKRQCAMKKIYYVPRTIRGKV